MRLPLSFFRFTAGKASDASLNANKAWSDMTHDKEQLSTMIAQVNRFVCNYISLLDDVAWRIFLSFQNDEDFRLFTNACANL